MECKLQPICHDRSMAAEELSNQMNKECHHIKLVLLGKDAKFHQFVTTLFLKFTIN